MLPLRRCAKPSTSCARQNTSSMALWGTGVLVETLLERGDQGDLAEAQEAIDRLANLWADQDSAMLEITLLRLRALLSRARGDDIALPGLGESLPRHGGIAWLRRTHRDGEGHEVRLASTLRPMASEYWPRSMAFGCGATHSLSDA